MDDNDTRRLVVVEVGTGPHRFKVINRYTGAVLGWNLERHVAESMIEYDKEVAAERAAALEHRAALERLALERDAQTLERDSQALEREVRKLTRDTPKRRGPEREGPAREL